MNNKIYLGVLESNSKTYYVVACTLPVQIGKLHTDDPKVKEACVKALTKLTTPFKKSYVPPGVVNWNDADDNNAFHAKLMVMDFDGTISTEIALYNKKELYDDIVTRGLPLGNDGKQLPSQVQCLGPVIPKGAKNVAVAKEFIKYAVQPKVLNAASELLVDVLGDAGRHTRAALGANALPFSVTVEIAAIVVVRTS